MRSMELNGQKIRKQRRRSSVTEYCRISAWDEWILKKKTKQREREEKKEKK